MGVTHTVHRKTQRPKLWGASKDIAVSDWKRVLGGVGLIVPWANAESARWALGEDHSGAVEGILLPYIEDFLMVASTRATCKALCTKVIPMWEAFELQIAAASCW